jgi:DNA-binding transcriptional MerR regulator
VIEVVDAKTLANAFGISDRTIRRLAVKGILQKDKNGHYNLAGSVQGYIEYTKQQAIAKVLKCMGISHVLD